MSAPTLKSNTGIYNLTWGEEQLAIRIDRLREDSKYTVSGEMTVKTSVPGSSKHLHQARLNLTSTQARQTIARHLNEPSEPHRLGHHH